MQITINSNKPKNKAADLKRMMQQACSKPNTTRLQSKSKDNFTKNIQRKQSDKNLITLKTSSSIKSTKFIKAFKQDRQNKRALETSTSGLNKSIKINKQNICQNKSSKTSAQKNTSLTNIKSPIIPANKSSTKNLKIATSLQIKKILNKVSSSTNLLSEKIFPTSTLHRHDSQKISSKYSKIKSNNHKDISLEEFKLGRKLGKGRFGNVYLAQHKINNFSLAIKIINIKQLKEAQMQQQLIEQIKLQTYMNHPNILKMYGFFNDQKNIYLLLQLGSGCLFKQLRGKGFFNQQQTAYYIKQIIEGLKYLHNQNIIHRDIKPENILMSQGVLKLSDFGWSIYSPVHKRQTFCGTLDYVPPQIVQGDYYDQKVDIWSLGVLLYQLSTGKAPFQTNNNDQQQTYDKILSVQLHFPQHLSEELKDLISKILVKEPKERLMIQQIQSHAWLQKYQNVGRYISKQIWQSWDNLK